MHSNNTSLGAAGSGQLLDYSVARHTLAALSLVIITSLAVSPVEAAAHSGPQLVKATSTPTPTTTHKQRGTQAEPDLVPVDPPGGWGGSGGGGSGGGSSTALDVKGFNMDTHDHTATLLMSNGLKWTLDGVKGTVTMTYEGEARVLSIDEVLEKQAGGDEKLKQQLKKRWMDALNVPKNNSRWVQLDSNTTDFAFQGKKLQTVPQNRTGARPDLINVPTLPPTYVFATPYSCYDFVWGCYYVELPPSNGAPHGLYHVRIGGGGGGGGTSADHKAWDRWRKDQCDEAKGDTIHAATGTVAIGLTWKGALAGSEGGPPEWATAVLALAAEAANVAWTQHEYNKHEGNCISSYPGEGNWP